MSNDDLITSTGRRLFKLGSVATRVGLSLATEQALSLLRHSPLQQARKTEKFVLNAMRVTEALGELKGAAMKVGQMLSVHEGMLPPEVAAVLRTLQKEAPQVSFSTMQRTLRAELPDFDRLFESLDPQAIAAASIGQVYRGKLFDGREVAVKVQYPDIDQVVRSDLKNLKSLFGSMIAMFSDLPFDQIWGELRDRLLEELDYVNEAENMNHMALLHRDIPEIVIPGVIVEASTRKVLTMEYVRGLTPEEACTDKHPQSLKNTWGANLMRFTVRGLLTHRFLHADPNFANFGFLDDGRVIVYDHGCMKAIEPKLARDFTRILKALVAGDDSALPRILSDMKVYKLSNRRPLRLDLITPISDVVMEIVGEQPYQFSNDTKFYDIVFAWKSSHFSEINDMNLPADMVFVNRTLGGLFGNLCRLHAREKWKEVIEDAMPDATSDQPEIGKSSGRT